MIVRNGIRSNLRAKGRTALFAALIVFLTLTLVLGLGVRVYCDEVLRQSDENYRSIALVEYMGAEYPDADEPDEFARAAAEEIDDAQLLSIDGVKDWSRASQSLVLVEGYTRHTGTLPYPHNAVLAAHNFLSTAEQYRMVEVEQPEEETYVLSVYAYHFLGYEVHELGKEPVFYPYFTHEFGSEDYISYEYADGEERTVICSHAELPERYALESGALGRYTVEVVGVGEGELHPTGWMNREQPARYDYYVLTDSFQTYRMVPVAYTAIVGRIVYASEFSGSLMVDIPIDGTDFVPEKGQSYLLHGEFLTERVRSLPSFQITPFEDAPEENPCAAYTSGDETLFTDSVFTRYAEKYATANNYVRLERARDIQDLQVFQQGILYLTQGRFPEPDEQNACVISGEMAVQLELSAGDSIRVTALAGRRENRFAVEKTDEANELTVVGVAVRNEDYEGLVWTTGEAEGVPLYGYLLGTVSLDNARGAEAVRVLQESMPENVRVTLLDQGYQDAVRPFASMRRTATTVLLVCAAGVLAVLVLFAFLFVGRQRETVQILTSLGTPKRKITLWLLSGAGMIAISASLLGGAAGLLYLPALIRRVNENAAATHVSELPYSDTTLGVSKELSYHVDEPYAAVGLTVLCVSALALLLCILFLQFARRSATAQRGKTRVRIPHGKTSVSGRGGLRFALLSMRRGGLRTLLMPLVSLALTLLILVTGSALGRWEDDLRQTRESTGIEGQVVSLNGQRYAGLVLPARNARRLAQQDFMGETYLSYGLHYWLPGEMPDFAANEYGDQLRTSWVQSRPELVALNALKGAKEFYYTEPELTWLPGWDESFLAQDDWDQLLYRAFGLADGETAYPAVVSKEFLQENGLSLGDSFGVILSYPFRVGTIKEVTVYAELRAVGSYRQTGAKAYLYVPLAAYIDPQWIFGEENLLDQVSVPRSCETREEIETYLRAASTFSTCRFRLRSADVLEQARETLQREGYAWANHSGGNRVALLLRDGAYLELTESLERNISLGRLIFPVIFALVALLGFVISWLMINGRKQEFAIMRGFGAKRGRVFLSFFWEQALLCTLGCAVGCLSLFRLGGGWMQALALGAYLACYLLGCAVSVLLVGRVNLMELLCERE